MNILLLYLSLFIASFFGALLGNYLWAKRKWRIEFDEKNNEIRLEIKEKEGKAEFISEPTAEEEQEALEEINKPEWKKFLDKFRLKVK